MGLGERQIRDAPGSGQGQNPSRPVAGDEGVFPGSALGEQGGLEVGQMVRQRPGLVGAKPDGLGVDQAGPDLRSIGFGVGGHRLGFAFVGATLDLVADPVGVNESVVPDPAALA